MDATTTLSLAGALVAGGLIGWAFARATGRNTVQTTREAQEGKYGTLEREFAVYKATSTEQLKVREEDLSRKEQELERLRGEIKEMTSRVSASEANLLAANTIIPDREKEIEVLKSEREKTVADLNRAYNALSEERANNTYLQEKLTTQKEEMEVMGRKFNTEFENIANKILETKTEKFTELNKSNLQAILEPLGKNISEFKTRVDEVYDKESKERFSLGERVRELVDLNQQIGKEARNLTMALKGEAKTQGRWGEMILESILERSGLVKDREYFIEYELKDDAGNALRSDSEGKKMRPDAVVNYPGDRRVIIDSKVSLNAFTRMVASDDPGVQRAELQSHVSAIKNHIVALSTKGYDDYDKALDFVMMFVPSEPAYNAALQGDADLWNFAYDRRILLLSPTNLITSLKLIVDLWKREYQNRNAQDIADRGAKLYDKFVGFVENLTDVGLHLDRAQKKYSDAYKQLSTGNDNLILQATRLKNLGLKTKKDMPAGLAPVEEEEAPALPQDSL